MSRPLRVLVVDDSAFARKVLRDALRTSSAIEVVDTARDGLDALEKIAVLAPDVVTLDLVMPNLDGIGVLRALPAVGAPRVVVVSVSGEETELGLEALALGAVDIVRKPTALATERLYELGAELVTKVLAAGTARPRPLPLHAPSPERSPPRGPRTGGTREAPAVSPSGDRPRVVVVGTSTGGPQAITRLLAAVPATFPCPIAIALHIPSEYTESLAARLDDRSPLRVEEARDGLVLAPGLAVLARGGVHLTFQTSGADVVCFLGARHDEPHHPSVDVLFESAAEHYGAGTVGVVLTGMGDDGTRGARRIRAAGGSVLTEAEPSCVVYGMPRAVFEAGLSDGQAPIEEMADLIARRLYAPD